MTRIPCCSSKRHCRATISRGSLTHATLPDDSLRRAPRSNACRCSSARQCCPSSHATLFLLAPELKRICDTWFLPPIPAVDMGSCVSTPDNNAPSSAAPSQGDPVKSASAASKGSFPAETLPSPKTSAHPSQHAQKHFHTPAPLGLRTDFGYARNFQECYKLGKELGHGQFGTTFLATDLNTQELLAVKTIKKKSVRRVGRWDGRGWDGRPNEYIGWFVHGGPTSNHMAV